jgi:hypothetical protein
MTADTVIKRLKPLMKHSMTLWQDICGVLEKLSEVSEDQVMLIVDIINAAENEYLQKLDDDSLKIRKYLIATKMSILGLLNPEAEAYSGREYLSKITKDTCLFTEVVLLNSLYYKHYMGKTIEIPKVERPSNSQLISELQAFPKAYKAFVKASAIKNVEDAVSMTIGC